MSWDTKVNKIITDRSVLSIILVNIFPIIGVIYLYWDAITIIKLYIIESAIIGFFNFKKIKRAKGKIKNTENTGLESAKSIARFFFVHYNGFLFIQTIFIYFAFSKIGNESAEPKGFFDLDFLLSVVLFIISEAYSYYNNYIQNKNYLTASPDVVMFLPYKRIVVQQLAVLIGGSVLMAYDIPLMLIILVVLKIFFDIMAHYKIHLS